MNFRRTLAIIGGLHLLILICFWRWQHQSKTPTPPPADARSLPSVSSNSRQAPVATDQGTLSNTEHGLADPLDAPEGTIRTDLEIVTQLVEAYRTNFPAQGNPVGENIEITAALTGNNPARAALIARNHRAINARGELCDRWGTPFFFHQLSGSAMEIRSAGPDKRLWTADDAVMSP